MKMKSTDWRKVMGKYVSIKKYIIFIIFGAILEIIVFLVWLCTKNNIDGRLKILRDDISKAVVVIGIVLIALNIYFFINYICLFDYLFISS